MLEIERLNVWFRGRGDEVHVVRDVNIDVGVGACVGLVGESGCGKTSIALAVLGLLPGDAAVSGDVRVGGHSLFDMSEKQLRAHRWTKIAFVPQAAMSSLNPVRTVGRQLEEVMQVRRGLTAKASRARAIALLERVDLQPATVRLYPHELSGGMKQRAVIALALTCDPNVLIADEVTTALDVVVQRQVLALLRSISTDENMAVLMISHDLAALSTVCDSLAVMHDGRVVDRGRTSEVIRNPQHDHTRALIKAAPVLGHRRTRTARPPEATNPTRPAAPATPSGVERLAT